MIPYGRQSIDDADIAAVVDVLRGDRITQGPAIDAFEAALCEVTGARHAIAMANGTAGLHAAAAAAGVGPGDVVATSPLTFAASAACALYVGATPRFIDVSPETLNFDPKGIEAADGAVVAVHYAGLPADLTQLAHRPRVVIEDAAHALGALTPDGPVGNCHRSDACVFSFHPVKPITTGEGGAVTTNDDDLADRLRRFRTHGIVPHHDQGGWFYEIATLGFNYRMTDIQAALGTSQLRRLERFTQRRNELAERYRSLLAGLPLELPPSAPAGWRHAYHLFPIRVRDRRRVYEELHRAGVGAQVHFIPVYRHPLYAPFTPEAGCAAVEVAYEQLLSLPIFPDLTDEQQDRVVAALKSALQAEPARSVHDLR